MSRSWWWIILLSASAPFANADRVTPIDDVRKWVNVRDAASNGAVIGRLEPGEYADLLDTAGVHYKIRLNDGAEGFVARRWSQIVPDAAALRTPTGQLALHFIDVGQGDSTLIVCPDNSTILVDSGSTSGMPPAPVRDYITEVLGPDVDTIDHLVITHADADHYNLLPDVMRGFRIGHVYYVGFENDYNSPTFWTWLDGFSEDRRTRLTETYFDASDSPHRQMDCGEADVYVLAAAVRSNVSWKNAQSIVLMIRLGEFKAVLTGDATHATEDVILSRYDATFLDAHLLKIGHHGSLATSTSEEWANTIRPEVAVVSSGERNGYGHPRQEVVRRLESHTINDPARAHPFSSATRKNKKYIWHDTDDYDELIYGTASSGNIVVVSKGNGFSVVTLLHGES